MSGRIKIGGVLLAAVLAGCSAGTGNTSSPPPTSSARPTYDIPPQQVRSDETGLHIPVAQAGDTTFLLLGITTGIHSMVGSHAEFSPQHGQFIRLRLVITNVGRSNVLFDTTRQTLLLNDGSTAQPDSQAMTIKRQPDQFNLGAGVQLEFDLYYDVTTNVKPTGLRVHGGPTLTDMKDEKGPDIKLPA
jgi:hypothetical protein